MDDQQRLIHWATENAAELGLRVSLFRWPSAEKIRLFDVGCEIEIDGLKSVGRGSDYSQEAAFSKGLAEALERRAFDISGIQHTNGFACHLDRERAALSGRRELIERDAFFCHYLTQTPFQKHCVSLSQVTTFADYFELLRDQGIEIFLVSARGKTSETVSVCTAFGLKAKHAVFGMSLGLGCNEDPMTSAQSAIIECMRHVAPIVARGEFEEITRENFDRLSRFRVEDHMALAMNLDYAKKVYDFFSVGQDPHSTESSIEGFEYSDMDLPGTVFEKAPFRIVRCRPLAQDQIQDLFFGPTTPKKVNLARLSRFMKRDFTWDEVYSLPHPLG